MFKVIEHFNRPIFGELVVLPPLVKMACVFFVGMPSVLFAGAGCHRLGGMVSQAELEPVALRP